MAKRVKRKRTPQRRARQTNWWVIGGVVAIGVVGLFALLFISLQGDGAVASETVENNLLANFCESNDERCVSQGDPSAPVTLVEVSDYGCGHCRNFNLEKAGPLERQYVESGQLQWVVMPYALRGQSGEYPTLPSVVAAMCANEQDRFFDYHAELFALQGSPLFNTREGFVEAATTLDLDLDPFQSCLDDNQYDEIILQNIGVASSAGIRSTPTFFINGRKVEGNLPRLEDFQQIIEEALDS